MFPRELERFDARLQALLADQDAEESDSFEFEDPGSDGFFTDVDPEELQNDERECKWTEDALPEPDPERVEIAFKICEEAEKLQAGLKRMRDLCDDYIVGPRRKAVCVTFEFD
jgi:hypothetical protein